MVCAPFCNIYKAAVLNWTPKSNPNQSDIFEGKWESSISCHTPPQDTTSKARGPVCLCAESRKLHAWGQWVNGFCCQGHGSKPFTKHFPSPLLLTMSAIQTLDYGFHGCQCGTTYSFDFNIPSVWGIWSFNQHHHEVQEWAPQSSWKMENNPQFVEDEDDACGDL